MGLKSLLQFVIFPFRFLWKHTNTFLPEKRSKMEKPTIIKEHEKTSPGSDIKSEPVNMQLTDTVVRHVRVDFTQPANNAFFANNGKIINTLGDLSSELTVMDDNTFFHHVNTERNDFANWVQDTIHAHELADDLRNATAPQVAREVLERHRL